MHYQVTFLAYSCVIYYLVLSTKLSHKYCSSSCELQENKSVWGSARQKKVEHDTTQQRLDVPVVLFVIHPN